jgi:short-subunit dehydrogenase
MYGGLSASKAALDSLTDALRMELRHQGVRVSYIEPGALQTEFFRKSAEATLRGGQAGTAETQRIYAAAIKASAKTLADSRTSPVERAVRAIVKALTARRPAPRYIVGIEAKMGLRVLLHLPAGVRDRVLMSSFGLSRRAFDLATEAQSERARAA